MSEIGINYFSPKGFFVFIGHCLLVALFGFLALEAWKGYQQEKLNIRFEKEGQPVTIRVTNVSHEKKSWKDHLPNSEYIAFTYNEKPYKIRYFQDSLYVMEGTRLVLLYDAAIDVFQQPRRHFRGPLYKTSKLVKWTVVSTFSTKNIWLFGFIVLSFILLLFVTGMLNNLTGIRALSRFIELLAVLFFVVGSIYITYDVYQLYAYVRQIRSNASQESVPLLDKSRDTQVNSHSSDDLWIFYTYSARVHYGNDDRIIAITEKDYDNVAVGQELHVFYNKDLDEMMSISYSPGIENLLFVGTIWILLLFSGRRLIRRRKSLNTTG